MKHFKHIKSVPSPISTLNQYEVSFLLLLFFQALYLPPSLGLFEAVAVIRMYLYATRTSKKL